MHINEIRKIVDGISPRNKSIIDFSIKLLEAGKGICGTNTRKYKILSKTNPQPDGLRNTKKQNGHTLMIKTKSMRIRLTDEEWQLAEKASLSLLGNTNKSQLMRKLLRDYVGMGPDLIDIEIEEFRKAVRQLTGISRNLNQIATRINSDEKQLAKISNEYLNSIKNEVESVNNQLKSYIKRTVNRYQDVVNHGE